MLWFEVLEPVHYTQVSLRLLSGLLYIYICCQSGEEWSCANWNSPVSLIWPTWLGVIYTDTDSVKRHFYNGREHLWSPVNGGFPAAKRFDSQMLNVSITISLCLRHSLFAMAKAFWKFVWLYLKLHANAELHRQVHWHREHQTIGAVHVGSILPCICHLVARRKFHTLSKCFIFSQLFLP